MKKIKIIGLLFCFLIVDTYAQQGAVTHGSVFKEQMDDYGEELIGATSSHVYLYKIKDGFESVIYKFKLRKCSITTLNEEFDKTIKIPKINKKEYRFRNFLIIKNNLLYCASSDDSGKEPSEAFIFPITADGTLMEKEMVMHEDKISKGYGKYAYSLSTDSSKILVWYTLSNAKTSNTIASCTVLDEKLKVIWKKKFEFHYESENCELTNQVLDNEGNLFFRLKKNPDKKDETGLSQIIHYNGNTDKTTTIPVTINNQYMLDCSLQFDKKGNLLYTGLYSSSEPKFKMFMGTAEDQIIIDGAFYYLIKKNTNEVIASATKSIEAIINKQYRAFYNLRKSILLDDGSVLLFAEYNKLVSHIKPASEIYRNQIFSDGQPVHTFGAVLVIGFHIQTKTEPWVKMINKYQRVLSKNIIHCSFMTINTSNTVYLIYNDNVKNKDIKEATAELDAMTLGQFMPMIITVSGTGEMKREPLLADPAIICPANNVRINKREFIFLGNTDLDQDKLTKIKLNGL
jgi:hypothetical protein